jgi:hypothetical protein
MTDPTIRDLHIRNALGEPLTEDERAALQDWYDRDEAENKIIVPLTDLTAEVERRRADLTARTEELVVLSHRIQEVLAENEVIKREIVELQRQLASRKQAQPA